MYDFIGDIHGRYDALVKLLRNLGYSEKHGTWAHPKRKAFFLGDLIDNGTQIRETLDLVKNMVQAGTAEAILGNHEFNFIGFHTDSITHPGEKLRRQTEQNRKQCQKTLEQIDEKLLNSYLDWLITLPMFFEGNGFRAVHACWDQTSIDTIKDKLNGYNTVNLNSIHSLYNEKNKLIDAAEIILKGPEVTLPDSFRIKDKYGKERKEMRVSWWNPNEIPKETPEAFDYIKHISEIEIPKYPPHEVPVFFGHYYKTGNPTPFVTSHNAQCLDYGLEKGGGYLTCYRFNGERQIDQNNLVWVSLG